MRNKKAISKLYFNQKQIDRLSEIFANLSVVFFASMVIPVFNQEFDILVLVMGISFGLASAWASLMMLTIK